MEIYQLRTFITVAGEKHLTRAAKRLHISQPAVSAHIKALEEELGVTLFHRTPKGMVPTTVGLKLKERAESAIATIDEMIAEVSEKRGRQHGSLRIGINAEPDSLRIPELFFGMQKHHPDVHIHLLQSTTDEVLNKLEDNLLDVGFMYGENESEKLHTIELQQLKLVVVGPGIWQDRLAQSTAEELGEFPWIMTPAACPFHTVASTFFKKHNMRPQQVVVIDQDPAIKAMVKAGAGLSLLLERDLAKDALGEKLAIWAKEDLYLKLSLACLSSRRNTPLLKALFLILLQIWGLRAPL